MAHEVENMFSVNEVPWHGLGRILQDAPTCQDAIVQAGLDWQVEQQPLFLADGRKVDENALIRSTDKSILGVVGSRYVPLQNNKAFDFFNPFVESKECTLETAGSLRNGKRIWILAALNRSPIEVQPNDFVKKYLLLSNSHDGTMAIRVGFTPIRVVCANTLAMAHTVKESKLLRVWHSKQTVVNLDKIREVINTANAEFEATAEQYKFLTTRHVNKEDIEKFVKVVFYAGTKPEDSRAKLAFEKLNDHITKLFEIGIGNKGDTYWDLYNATTQYLSYDYGRQQDTRINNLWFGLTKDINKLALDTCLNMVA